MPRQHDSKCNGFTLVELLVVIAIIGILVALLLPAVQSARESACRRQCLSQVKQLMLGSINHHDVVGHFPTGGWGWFWTGDPDRGFDKDQPGGWIYNQLPFIEETALHDLGSDGQPDVITDTQRQGAADLIETSFLLITCPSRRGTVVHPIASGLAGNFKNADTPELAGRADYAANSGTFFNEFNAGSSDLEGRTFRWARDLHPDKMNGVSFQASEISIAKITDGTSHTLLIGEKAHVPSAYDTGSFGGDNETWCTGFNNDLFRMMAGNPEIVGRPTHNQRFLGPISDSDAEGLWVKYRQNEGITLISRRFGSANTSLFIAGLCDGSARGISYDADFFVLKRLADRQG